MTSEEIKAVPLVMQQKLDRKNAEFLEIGAILEQSIWLKEIAYQLALHYEFEVAVNQKNHEALTKLFEWQRKSREKQEAACQPNP